MKRAARHLVTLVLTLASAGALPMVIAADAPEQAPRRMRAQAIERLAQGGGDASIKDFIDEQLTPKCRESFEPGKLVAMLRDIRGLGARAGGLLNRRVGEDGLRMTFVSGPREQSVFFRIEPSPPYRIVHLELEAERDHVEDEDAGPASPPSAPYTWDTLESRLDDAAKSGFSGTVLVVRGGKIILHRGYGFANRERKIPNGTDTIFAIGSTPIDFTRAAILKLEEMGKLRTSDLISKHLPGVPPDKSAMTIDHLMQGQSGLPNFHHVSGVDADADLTWIDRDTAVKRILGRELLFAPGQGRAHSHSAWVLLAAVVEIVSGEPYGDFLRKHFFEPAGMERTGLHEDAARFADDQFAVGYEGQPVGVLNIPKYWGRTSWLVMGSGGMQSTPMDMYRWMKAIRGGVTLSPAQAAKYWTGGVLAGGDSRGNFCIYTEGLGDLAIMFSNAQSPGAHRADEVGDHLVHVVREGSAPKFSLGIEMQVTPAGGVMVKRVLPGSAAERDGVREGDILLSANGKGLEDPATLRTMLATGEPITFAIEREGARQNVTVKPDLRSAPAP